MAKGQKRSNREVKKPKAVKKPTVGAKAPEYQLSDKLVPAKGGAK